MRVLYDVSMLGYGFASPEGGRTGIHRVVSELALRLAASPRCNLSLCAIDSLAHARSALAGTPALSGVPFQWSPAGLQLRARLHEIEQSLQGGSRSRRLALRLQRKALTLAHRRCGGLPYPAYYAPDVSRVDVFHSPNVPIPEKTRRERKVTKFQTVYDLAPLLLPETAIDEHRRYIGDVIAGIGGDGWALAISQATKDDLCGTSKIDPARVFVTPLAADRDRFHPCHDEAQIASVRARYGIPQGRYILSVCTLQPRKNLDRLIGAFRRLAHEPGLADCALVLTGGEGWKHKAIYEEIARSPALKDRIVLTGYVNDADLAPLYSGATVFAYPSLYEGFGLPPLEAMQCGTPVVTSNTSSLPEVVGDAGLLVDPRDEDALCQALLGLLTVPELRAELSLRSVARAALFSWEACAAQTLDAYEYALNISRP